MAAENREKVYWFRTSSGVSTFPVISKCFSGFRNESSGSKTVPVVSIPNWVQGFQHGFKALKWFRCLQRVPIVQKWCLVVQGFKKGSLVPKSGYTVVAVVMPWFRNGSRFRLISGWDLTTSFPGSFISRPPSPKKGNEGGAMRWKSLGTRLEFQCG